MDPKLSLVHGPKEPTLWTKTLRTLIEEQAAQFGNREAVVFPWQSIRLSFRQLAGRSRVLAMSMLDAGLRHGDCIGIMAGNCVEYVEVFLGGARIGCPVVVLNNTYTAQELKNAVLQSSCRIVFIASAIGTRSLSGHIQELHNGRSPNPALAELLRVVCLGDGALGCTGVEIQSYSAFAPSTRSVPENDLTLKTAEDCVVPEDIANLQFTSGTTGTPKAAMLTHINLINNGRFICRAMAQGPDDVVCCPPPLFHCFGLVIGFLASFCCGNAIVFPSDYFDARRCVDAIMRERTTILLGVPTMYLSIMEVMAQSGRRPRRLGKAIAAGTSVPQVLRTQLRQQMGVHQTMICYGMTETSPVTIMTSVDDPEDKQTVTVGRALPHTAAKVIDVQGNILPRGERGELCTSGFALQKGYWKNEKKTREVMKMDEDGVRWMYTGDEGIIDNEGYTHITGRIKDVIIRGGENIFPLEIEERLIRHPAIREVSVVGIKNWKYGEVVGCFLRAVEGPAKPSDHELRKWTAGQLGMHKAPEHVFWIGDPGVGEDFPKTGSGKHQKHIMRHVGTQLVEKSATRARL